VYNILKTHEKGIYEYSEYKAYLEKKVGSRGQRKGLKSKLAKALHCQPTYISQVLHGNAHLSLEQSQALNEFFGHTKEEGQYFLLLVQKDRAGTVSLRRHFEEQLQSMLQRRMVLTERLGKKQELSKEDQIRYYSSWHYAAIHMALTVPELQNAKALSEYFRIPIKKVTSVLDFLNKAGLARHTETGSFQTGKLLIRLGNDSPNILRHHSNWRQQAMDSLDREEIGDLHYSAVVSLSKKDAIRIKDRILEWLEKDLEIIKDSKEEEIYSYCIDFFHMRR
jgi:uncharacterized protein (TIGR02147 family)